ncbi:MAG: hypothetical protein AAF533_03760 [Acidobacteriota bacterium]
MSHVIPDSISIGILARVAELDRERLRLAQIAFELAVIIGDIGDRDRVISESVITRRTRALENALDDEVRT